MKLLASLLVLVTLAGVISGASKEKRGNIGAALGLGLNIAATTPAAYPTIPSLVNQLTSNLFSPNKTTGESPLYGLMKMMTSNIYPFLSNTTYNILTPLNNLINGVSSNLYNGLCAPPMPNITVPTGGPVPNSTPASSTNAPASSNPITTFINILTGKSGTPGSTTGSDPISQLIAALTSAAGNTTTSTTNMFSTILGTIANHFGTDASTFQSLINSISGSLAGTTAAPGASTTQNPLIALLNNLLNGVTGNGGINLSGLFPGVTVSGGVNTTLNLSPNALNQILSSIGQTIQSLQTALENLGITPQSFVNGLAQYGNVASYLQSIFDKLNALTNGLFPGQTVTGSVNLTLNLSPADFIQRLTQIGQTVSTLQATLQKLNATAQIFVNGLAAYNDNVSAYLQAIFTYASAPPPASGGTNTLQGLLNTVLNAVNNALSGTGLINTISGLLQSILG